MLLRCQVSLNGWGHTLPDQILDNAAVIARGALPLTPEWITRRIGVEQRHVLPSKLSTSDLALAAAKKALHQAAVSPQDLDLIVLSTLSPDHPSPATACLVQAALGNTQCPAFDLSAACSGFLYALDTGLRHILTGARHVLVISAETRSRFVDPQDPATAAIFGDGAGAVVLSQQTLNPAMTVQASALFADGRGYYAVHTPAGGARLPASESTVAQRQHFIQMPHGEQIFFQVVESMTHYTTQFLKELQLDLDDIDYIIPHQANLNILQEVGRRLTLPPGKMLINLPQVGNTSSASIPIALSQFAADMGQGKRVLLVAVGAGHTLGLTLVHT